MSIWNWCLSCCGWRPSKASTSAGSPWDRSETVRVNKDAILWGKRKEWSRTPPPSANKKVGKLKKEHLEEVGPGEHERGTKLALGHVEQAWWGARLPWTKAPVSISWCCGSLCSFSGLSVCLFLGLVYMNGGLWFTHLLRGFSLGVPKTLAGGTNLGIDNHMFSNIQCQAQLRSFNLWNVRLKRQRMRQSQNVCAMRGWNSEMARSWQD